MKTFIKNRKGQKICVLVDKPENQKGLVFVMHGHGGEKYQPHIKMFADAFADNNYTVVRFDTTNTFGESDGNYEDSTITNYYEDLEDVISWSKSQDFYSEPFVLAGHSVGGMCITLYAQKYPKKVKALAPISTVVSGKLTLEEIDKKELEEWRRTGYKTSRSETHPERIKKIKYAYFEDKIKYDLIDSTDKLTMPILMIVGDSDANASSKHQKILYDKLTGRKELHIIKGAPHTFRDEKHLSEIKSIFDKWIKTLTL